MSSSSDEITERVHQDLKSRGYVVTTGFQYGFDFMIYEGDPASHHALYLVHIVQFNDTFDILDVLKDGRVAMSVRKKCLIAIPTKDSVRYLELGTWNERIQ